MGSGPHAVLQTFPQEEKGSSERTALDMEIPSLKTNLQRCFDSKFQHNWHSFFKKQNQGANGGRH
jgi:hypothetical protein